MDSNFKRQSYSDVKLSGLSSGLDLDEDKLKISPLTLSAQQQLEAERMQRYLLNRQFDPTFMEFNIDGPSNTGDITFNPTDMKFKEK